jgi:hypothetical protein
MLHVQGLWTVDELSRYNEMDEGLPILLPGIFGYFFKFVRARFVLREKRGLQRDKAWIT